MKKEKTFSAPQFGIQAAFSLEEAYKRGPVILVFYDRHGSDF